MLHFTPTYGAGDTARNVRNFMRQNNNVFWDVMKPLIPWFVGLLLLDFIIHILFYANLEQSPSIGAMISSYFTMMLIITWHRVVIHGPDRYVPANPLKPTKNELMFGVMGLAIAVMIVFPIMAVLGLGFLLKIEALLALLMIGAFIVSWVAFFRLSFYFPAKAINADITLGQSWKLSQGYFWKYSLAMFFALWRLMLLMIGYVIIAGLVLGFLAGIIFKAQDSPANSLIGFVLALPLAVFFQPVMTAIGVTVVSNYYQWAWQNKRSDQI